MNKELFLVLLIFMLSVVALFMTVGIVLFLVGTPLNMASCSHYAKLNPQLEFEYDWLTGCNVRLSDGVWYSASKVVGIQK